MGVSVIVAVALGREVGERVAVTTSAELAVAFTGVVLDWAIETVVEVKVGRGVGEAVRAHAIELKRITLIRKIGRGARNRLINRSTYQRVHRRAEI